MRQAASAVHDPRVCDLNAAEHRPNLALAVILDPPETLAIHAEPARQNVRFALLFDDHLLEMSHDRLAVLDRKPDLAGRQARHILVDHKLRTMGSRTRPCPPKLFSTALALSKMRAILSGQSVKAASTPVNLTVPYSGSESHL